MRYNHISNTRVRKVMLTRLSYIVTLMLNNGKSQASLAAEAGVTVSAISAIKNKRYKSISLDRILMVADGLGLDYDITIGNKNGEKYALVNLPSYDEDVLIKIHAHQHTGVSARTTSAH